MADDRSRQQKQAAAAADDSGWRQRQASSACVSHRQQGHASVADDGSRRKRQVTQITAAGLSDSGKLNQETPDAIAVTYLYRFLLSPAKNSVVVGIIKLIIILNCEHKLNDIERYCLRNSF